MGVHGHCCQTSSSRLPSVPPTSLRQVRRLLHFHDGHSRIGSQMSGHSSQPHLRNDHDEERHDLQMPNVFVKLREQWTTHDHAIPFLHQPPVGAVGQVRAVA